MREYINYCVSEPHVPWHTPLVCMLQTKGLLFLIIVGQVVLTSQYFYSSSCIFSLQITLLKRCQESVQAQNKLYYITNYSYYYVEVL